MCEAASIWYITLTLKKTLDEPMSILNTINSKTVPWFSPIHKEGY